MEMTSQQAKIAREWLTEKVSPRCPACGSLSVHLDTKILVLPDADGVQTAFVSVICTNCFHVALFLADPIFLGPSGFDSTGK